MHATRIVIADDHPIVRQGLRNIVASAADLIVSGELSTADEVRSAALVDCDVLVLDLGLPGGGSASVIQEVRQRRPTLPILVLSVSPEEPFALRALQEGASGYLSKRTAPERLIDAIRCVREGRVYASAAVAAALVRRGSPPSRSRPSLTKREIEIVRDIVAGLSLTAIGAKLGVSVKSVSTYRRRALAKLHLDSNAALVRFAIDHDLADAERSW